MATLNLSTHGPSITSSYRSVVDAPAPSGPAASSPTYGQWSVFSVSTPLVNAFQQNAPQKESVLKVQSTGEGELIDLIEEFSDGRIQFAFVKVKDPNTGLPKNVLVAWCGEGVPERTKGYFTSHLAAITKFFDGYHVQVTARSDRDLSPEAIVQKVADSSGAKYSGSSTPQPPSTANKPPVASKPAFNPTQTTSSFKPLGATRQPAVNRQDVDEDGWGADAPQVTRTQLEKVASAYQPTKVNMKDLMSQKSSTTTGADRSANESRSDVVKGGYQPIGKVDIAAIRRQAREAGQTSDDRPAPVKGSYEPVGKVDIAAIRAKAQGGDSPSVSASRISPAVTGASGDGSEPKSLAERSSAFNSSERLTTLPKPKVANKFGSASTFTGTKAPLPGEFGQNTTPSAAPIGVASRTFADQGGKTPAQIWAEKKAKQQGGTVQPPPASLPEQTTGGQGDQGGWKSSYTGKSWATVQTTHTGTSSGPVDAKHEDEDQSEEPSASGVGSIRERFANVSVAENHPQPASYERSAPSPPPLDTSNKPSAAREAPPPPLPVHPSEADVTAEQPRQPSPPPVESPPGSPIRVAMPVGRGSAEEPAEDVHEDRRSPSPAPPPAPVARSAPAEQQAQGNAHGDGIKAIAQYDYEKTEDNEIEMREGELITNIDMVDEDWWLGVNSAGDSGLFPRNYVEVVVEEGHGNEPKDAQAAPASRVEPPQEREAPPPETNKPQGPTATALYDYEMTEDNEIGFPEGAKITNIQFPDEDWWLGEYKGKVGLFPGNYVQLDD